MVTTYPNMPELGDTLDIVAAAGRIGGEVRNLELCGDLDDITLAALHLALSRHKVLFFRDQHRLDDGAQQAFGRRFGTPVRHPTAPAQMGEFLLELDSHHGGKSNVWHTDVTFVKAYPYASILRAVTIPAAGGDTVWANTAEAYLRLPASLQSLADTLWSVHSNDYDYAVNQTQRDEGAETYQAQFISTVYEAEHPLVRAHPLTGERSLVLGAFFKKFVGLGSSDSRHLFEIFQGHITRLENTVRWHWRQGDVAIWDNRSTQHYAIDDYGDQRRIVRRVTVMGDVPVAIDGRQSRQIKPAVMAEFNASQ